jgi:L-iditol 2-dehydrogenase
MSEKVLGAFAEYVLLPAHIVRQNVYRKPDGLGFREAAFLEPLSCVVHGMRPSGVGEGETVLVIGSGPIGLLHLLLAKSKGARVLITGLERERLKVAELLGADLTCVPSATTEAVAEFTDGVGVDQVFECTGQGEVWESSVNYVRRGGTVTLFGGCKAGVRVNFDAGRLHYDEITLKGTFHFTPSDVREAFRLLAGGGIKVKKMISGAYPLDDIQEVFSRLTRGEGIKYAIIP